MKRLSNALWKRRCISRQATDKVKNVPYSVLLNGSETWKLCMFIHDRPSRSNGTTEIDKQTTCTSQYAFDKKSSQRLLDNTVVRGTSSGQCLPASQIICRPGVPSHSMYLPRSTNKHSPRTQNERHSAASVQITLAGSLAVTLP